MELLNNPVIEEDFTDLFEFMNHHSKADKAMMLYHGDLGVLAKLELVEEWCRKQD